MSGRDPVTPAVRAVVLARDHGRCVAPGLGALDPCAGPLTLDHVRDQPPVGAPIAKRPPERRHSWRAPSDAAHLVTVCRRHHLDGWATAHRPELRGYLSRARAF